MRNVELDVCHILELYFRVNSSLIQKKRFLKSLTKIKVELDE